MNTSNAALGAFSVSDRVILVVGGTRGIGKAISLQLARAGAIVVANHARDRDAATTLADLAMAEELRLDVVRADATSDMGLDALAAALAVRGGRLDALVFAAATGVHRPLRELSARHFDFTFALNVKAFMLVTQRCLPAMGRGTSIVVLSSEGAVRAMHQYHLVGSSKAALESLARHFATELASDGIRVNVLAPGAVQTEAWRSLPDAAARLESARGRTPRGVLNSLEEVAYAAHFLVSDASAGMTGHTLVVDAGARTRGSG